ncbi:hypothetical protein [Actinacidiphila reveromycinica]|nr:hypothetical protein [Streptomyces sp. SN-593]
MMGTVATIISLAVSLASMIGSVACAWYAREAVKARGKHRKR